MARLILIRVNTHDLFLFLPNGVSHGPVLWSGVMGGTMGEYSVTGFGTESLLVCTEFSPSTKSVLYSYNNIAKPWIGGHTCKSMGPVL